jgi:hypothetical protein
MVQVLAAARRTRGERAGGRRGKNEETRDEEVTTAADFTRAGCQLDCLS